MSTVEALRKYDLVCGVSEEGVESKFTTTTRHQITAILREKWSS